MMDSQHLRNAALNSAAATWSGNPVPLPGYKVASRGAPSPSKAGLPSALVQEHRVRTYGPRLLSDRQLDLLGGLLHTEQGKHEAKDAVATTIPAAEGTVPWKQIGSWTPKHLGVRARPQAVEPAGARADHPLVHASPHLGWLGTSRLTDMRYVISPRPSSASPLKVFSFADAIAAPRNRGAQGRGDGNRF
jgi:hypothetical protein